MARTRGAAKAFEQRLDDAEDVVVDNAKSVDRAASFEGKLQQFEYQQAGESASGDTPNSTAKNDAKSASSNNRKRRLNATAAEEAEAMSPNPSTKKSRQSSKYAPPSKYAHLSPLTDILEPNLIGVFVGFNPGVQTATAGHAYAHPSNHFWKLLHSSGLTDRRLLPAEDRTLPARYGMGNTNLVSRPTRDAGELSRAEQVASVPALEAKIRRFKPEAVCIVGKSIWENIWCFHRGKKPSKAEFRYGWQDEAHNMGLVECEDDDETDREWKGARVFVATSTSGLSASLKPAEKEAIWKPFGEWVQRRREERRAELKEQKEQTNAAEASITAGKQA